MSVCERGIDCIECNSRGMCNSYATFKYKQGRAEAIKKFKREIKKNSTILLNDNGICHYYEYAISINDVEKIAEQLESEDIYE